MGLARKHFANMKNLPLESTMAGSEHMEPSNFPSPGIPGSLSDMTKSRDTNTESRFKRWEKGRNYLGAMGGKGKPLTTPPDDG